MTELLSVKEYRLALRDNKLLGLKCRECGFTTCPPRPSCRNCGGMDMEKVQLSGRGKVATFTSVYITPENRRGQAPYLVIAVELEEGPWVMGNIQGADPANTGLDLIGKSVYMNNNLIPNDKKPPEDIAPMFVMDQPVKPVN